MESDIKCMECGKGTRHFELGHIVYDANNPTDIWIRMELKSVFAWITPNVLKKIIIEI